jgi:hypothetical protein
MFTTYICSVSIIPMNAKSFEDLLVWQKAHAFVLEIYRLTDALPKSELFALGFVSAVINFSSSS